MCVPIVIVTTALVDVNQRIDSELRLVPRVMTNEKVRPITNRPTTVADHCSALYPLGLHDVLMPCNIISTVYMHLTADKHQMCLIQNKSAAKLYI